MNESKNRKIGSILSVLNMSISTVIGLVYIPFALRYLGNSEYGVFTLASGLIAYLAIFDMGFGNALVRYSARFKKLNKSVDDLYGFFLLLFMAIAFAVFIIGLVMYFNIESFFSSKMIHSEVILLKSIFFILLINVVFSFPSSVFAAIIRAHERFIFANTMLLLRNILIHGGYIVLLIWGFRAYALSLSCLLLSLLFFIINIVYSFYKLRIKISFHKVGYPMMKEIFVYSFFVFLNLVICQLYDNTDYVILGKFSGSMAISVYSIGVVFMTSFQQLSTSISSVYLPYMSKVAVEKDGIDQMSRVFNSVGKIQFVLLLFVLVGFIVYGPDFIKLWVGKDYHDAYFIALIIMVPSLVPLSQNIGVSILQALNKHSVRSNAFLVIALLNVIISIPLAISYNAIGSAIGSSIGVLLGQILFMNWYYSKRIGLDIRLYWSMFLSISLRFIPVLLFMICTNMLINMDGWGGLIVKIILSSTISCLYIYMFVLNQDEKMSIKNTIIK